MTDDFVQIKKPHWADTCRACEHTFEKHYTTYGTLVQGCSEFECDCFGFAITYRVSWLNGKDYLPM